MYKVKKNDREGIDYLNISSLTSGEIGRRLAYNSSFNAVNTLIGKITTLRAAMDFIITPNYPAKFLHKSKFAARDIAKIPTDKVEIPNYWAIVTHFVFERIYQDKHLLNNLRELNPDIKFTSYNKKKNYSSGLGSSTFTYNVKIEKYVDIIESIYGLIHKYDGLELEEKAKELIYNNKDYKEKNLFEGVPFKIEFDDSQLKAS